MHVTVAKNNRVRTEDNKQTTTAREVKNVLFGQCLFTSLLEFCHIAD